MPMRAFRTAPRSDALRILIVEDEALVALEIEGMLAMAGHEPVGQADDLPSALAAAESEKPDLALVDIQLAQGTSGLDVAAALKERGVPVLFATGNCPTERGRGLALGCLHKPISDRALAAAIETAGAVLRGTPLPAHIPSALHLY
ncbi:Two-component response regulator [Rubellimicrobium mesophilum DSM 19309]|uniref:Two-component response regulator n=1 Tax=Rubellimicrobium mesophilum DSM 19309 TaxID=442562 RepID=A0A017HJ31_9RHOB|nr:response regulator [Rubellimicrobium mesophilum]EYD74340.1 Two-component response regulator [Rubellimicrobium mesophilum DSM 19309]